MKIWVGLFLLLVTLQASALEVPRAISMGGSNFTSRSLSHVCFGMDALIEGLPCNPAFTAKDRRSQFQTQFFFGNNVSYVRDVSQLLDGTGDEGTVERLFNQKASAEMEANIQASFIRETWGLGYSPYRLFYYSLIRNSALPVITLYAGQEQSLSGQIASFVKDNFYWGLQLRAVDRKFILSEFTLTDALASGGNDNFDSKTQRALYIEPGVLYSFEEKPWKPQVGLTIKNAGLVDKKYDELSTSPDWHLAGSVRPPVGMGELELGVDFLFNSYIEEAKEMPRIGASYKLGAMQALASYGAYEYSAGFLLHYDGWNGGLTYWRKKFENLVGEQDQLQTVYLELGFVL
ncbi:hypothetical protein [Bdellovibrio sp. HCB337]|uniref:hypothetical protein n=1 Tax=Bdellovibrio sp. HCB337 TaxID=3394358 RepID=UPI0039A5337B